jgi:putative phosphoribosyl transferase
MTAKIYEIEKLHDQRLIFRDRFEAGETLGSMLQPEYAHIDDGIVLAIPSGGVPIGIKLRDTLGLPFDLLIARKLQIPGNPEAGFGAMTLNGTVFLNKSLLATLRLTSTQIEDEKKRVGLELERRNVVFRGARPMPDLTGIRVILVDDGLASGFTMLASVDMAKKANARETIVAVPTAPQSAIDRLASEADAIYCADIRTGRFFAVAEAFRNWYDLSEKEVLELLQT